MFSILNLDQGWIWIGFKYYTLRFLLKCWCRLEQFYISGVILTLNLVFFNILKCLEHIMSDTASNAVSEYFLCLTVEGSFLNIDSATAKLQIKIIFFYIVHVCLLFKS